MLSTSCVLIVPLLTLGFGGLYSLGYLAAAILQFYENYVPEDEVCECVCAFPAFLANIAAV